MVKYLGSQKLSVDFQLHGGSAPLAPALLKVNVYGSQCLTDFHLLMRLLEGLEALSLVRAMSDFLCPLRNLGASVNSDNVPKAAALLRSRRDTAHSDSTGETSEAAHAFSGEGFLISVCRQQRRRVEIENHPDARLPLNIQCRMSND